MCIRRLLLGDFSDTTYVQMLPRCGVIHTFVHPSFVVSVCVMAALAWMSPIDLNMNHMFLEEFALSP